jgi:hypothetical protein
MQQNNFNFNSINTNKRNPIKFFNFIKENKRVKHAK